VCFDALMTGTFGTVCHARSAAGKEVAIKVFTLSTQHQSFFAETSRHCCDEFELLQHMPMDTGLVHGAGQKFIMETASTDYYLAIPMNFFSHVSFEVRVLGWID